MPAESDADLVLAMLCASEEVAALRAGPPALVVELLWCWSYVFSSAPLPVNLRKVYPPSKEL